MGGAQMRQAGSAGSATVSLGMSTLTTGAPRRRASSSVHGARGSRAAKRPRHARVPYVAVRDGVAERRDSGARDCPGPRGVRRGPEREARQGEGGARGARGAQGA